MVYLKKVTEGCGAYIAVKQEMFQPTSSIKDRYKNCIFSCVFLFTSTTMP